MKLATEAFVVWMNIWRGLTRVLSLNTLVPFLTICRERVLHLMKGKPQANKIQFRFSCVPLISLWLMFVFFFVWPTNKHHIYVMWTWRLSRNAKCKMRKTQTFDRRYSCACDVKAKSGIFSVKTKIKCFFFTLFTFLEDNFRHNYKVSFFQFGQKYRQHQTIQNMYKFKYLKFFVDTMWIANVENNKICF